VQRLSLTEHSEEIPRTRVYLESIAAEMHLTRKLGCMLGSGVNDGGKQHAKFKKLLEKGATIGVDSDAIMVPAGPRPLRDDNLMVVAATMMQRSLDAGKNDVHVQYDTVRQFWSAVHNQWRASDEGQAASVMMRGTTKLMTSTCPTNGEWFERFMLGFHKRVGGVSRPDLAVSIEVMLALMQRFDRLWILAEGDSKKQQEVLFPALLAVAAYAGGLRGEEVPLMDLFSTFKHFAEEMNHPKHPHVVIALRGRLKNKIGELEHLKPLVTKTRLGLDVGIWFSANVDVVRTEGHDSRTSVS